MHFIVNVLRVACKLLDSQLDMLGGQNDSTGCSIKQFPLCFLNVSPLSFFPLNFLKCYPDKKIVSEINVIQSVAAI